VGDAKLREAERHWLAAPNDQTALAAAIGEHRRAGKAVPPTMLAAQLFPALTFRSKATFFVRVEKPDGAVEEVGESGKKPIEIPRHRSWWVTPILQVRRRYPSAAAARPEQERLLRSALTEVAKQRIPGLALGAYELFASAERLLHLEVIALKASHANIGLEPLTKFEQLRRLDLTYSRADLRPLRELREVIHLILVGCTGVDLAFVPRSTVRLSLGLANDLDASLAGIEALPALARLSVVGEVSDVGAGHVSRASRLVELRFDHALITDSGLRRLAKGLPRLEILSLDHCQTITDKGMAAIATMSSLRRLSLDDCGGVTAKGIARLAALTNLEVVYVRAAKHLHLNDDRSKARIALREALPRCKVY
jgi:hypothetical protein